MEAGQRVCVYYCSTYYKAVREGGGGGFPGECACRHQRRLHPLARPLVSDEFRPLFPSAQRCGSTLPIHRIWSAC